jgi:hypothetical protein
MAMTSDVAATSSHSGTDYEGQSYPDSGGGTCKGAPLASFRDLGSGASDRPPRYRLTRRDKTTWTVGVNGICGVAQHVIGTGYIQHLVASPNRLIEGVTLRGNDRNVLGPDFSPMYFADPETIDDVLSELADLNQAIADARLRQDEHAQERKQQQKEFLIQYFLEAVGRSGQFRKLKGPELDEACQKAVAAYRRTGRINRLDKSISHKEWHAGYSALRRAFETLRSAGMPGQLMAKHLQATIDMAAYPSFVYRPPRPTPHWDL